MPTRFLITLGLIVLAEFYSFFLVRNVLRPMPGPWRVGILITYIVLTLLTWSGMIFFRRIDWAGLPHMTRNLFVAFTFGMFVGKVLILAIMLIDDIRRLFLFIALKLFPEKAVALPTVHQTGVSRSAFLKTVALMLGGTALGGFLYGVTNRYRYKVRKTSIRFPNLPHSFRGLRIVQISDIHAGSFDNIHAVERGVQLILDQKPDIIFFTGDLVNNKAEEIKPYMSVFSKLKAPLGVYSVLGNHDYGDYVEWPSREAKVQNLQELKQIQARMGWRLLMNEHVELERNGEKIAVLGIENWGNRAHFPKYGDLKAAYQGAKDIPFKILLSHDPSHFDAEVSTSYHDIDLTLSGHTHGMQFGIEIPGLKWSPIKYVYEHWAGLYKVGRQYLYVNRGYGFLAYPGRLGILPEITVIDLT